MTRILVAGGRSHPDRSMVWRQLDRAVERHGHLTVAHGACVDRSTGLLAGADRWADEWVAINQNIANVERYPAADFGPWPACGPIRNAHMVKRGAAKALGFPEPGSRGTWNCLRFAYKAGIPIRIYRLPDDPPKRITRRRTSGWRTPLEAVSVTRPGRWGNPYVVEDHSPADFTWNGGRWAAVRPGDWVYVKDAQHAVALFERIANANEAYRATVRRELAGRDLACWCRDGGPCHADVLLRIANGGNP